MSMQNKEINCALCHAYLFSEDDVVYCPVCGAPHHRECYNSKGECALAELHGTENQYDKVKRIQEEQQVKEEAKEETETEQRSEYQTPFGNFSPVDFLGGVRPDAIIEDGVTATEAAKFVMSNTMRYIPKFASGKKVSWNFLAFLTPCGWFLSRKMYRNGIIAGVIQLISSLLSIPFQNILISLGITGSLYSAQNLEIIAQNSDKIASSVIMILFIGSILSTALSILAGIFGDWLYKKHTVQKIKEIKEQSENIELEFRKKGGVNFVLFFIAIFGLQNIFALLATLI